MRSLLEFAALLLLGALLVVLGVILGDYAPWYFAWIVGTAMIVLVSAAALAWLDAQDSERGPRAASLPRDKS
jgi:predicted outer membrane lipoprotein